MPVSGLAITLSTESDKREQTLTALRSSNHVTVGDVGGHRLALVVDTTDSETDRAVWRWLHELPGVRFVDVVCVYADDAQPADGYDASRDTDGAATHEGSNHDDSEQQAGF